MSYKSYITTPVNFDMDYEDVPVNAQWRKRAHKLYERRWHKLADKMSKLDYNQLQSRHLIF